MELEEGKQNGEKGLEAEEGANCGGALSKSAQKKLLKQQKWEAKKAEKKALEKEHKKKEGERKRKDWEELLASVSHEEREKLIESRKCLRKERMEKRAEEREQKTERLSRAKESGQKIVIDLEFSELMTPAEINSLVQQIMYCYAVNKRCSSPGHLWLTGCKGEMATQLKRLPGFDNWIIEKEDRSYMEAFASEDEKQNLVYLTADSENVVEELDSSKIYIVGGLVDRNRWKGITMKKAEEQGIQTAKLPIANYLNMSSSQVLTVNQVIEILLKFLETRDWKDSFFQVIPQRKRCQAAADPEEEHQKVKREEEYERESEEKDDQFESSKKDSTKNSDAGSYVLRENPLKLEKAAWADIPDIPDIEEKKYKDFTCLGAGHLREKHPDYVLVTLEKDADIPHFHMEKYKDFTCLKDEQLRKKSPDYILVTLEKDARSDIPHFYTKKCHVHADMSLGEFVDFIQLQIGFSNKKPISNVFIKNFEAPTGAVMSYAGAGAGAGAVAAGESESDSDGSNEGNDNIGDDNDADDDIEVIAVDSDDDGGGELVGGGRVPVVRVSYGTNYRVGALNLQQLDSVAAVEQQVLLLLANYRLNGIDFPNNGYEIDYVVTNGARTQAMFGQQLEAIPWPVVVQILVRVVALERFLPRMVDINRRTPDNILHFVGEVDLRTCDDVSDLEDQVRDALSPHHLDAYADPEEYSLTFVCDVPHFPQSVFKTKDLKQEEWFRVFQGLVGIIGDDVVPVVVSDSDDSMVED